ncbi:hypothetical protein DFQ14_10828 [Halopolyspora algeriensis]|uniref:Uncharacterized protein n=1 Tax=Halopolyspora algeriensis TaxID=1500506 RepID=A0A368VPH6_9ACTN|nr:hypothetical protein [Halopolyspora algeriensis]RCW42772.1 hypothetical protein DFQ14_10828 [Halopolyspora algeriensis]TQM56758.1 hypothetical protein FHU43_1572 [Halopolyspora algeriensis]
MAEILTDERVAAALRPFVRAAVPVLQILREADPLRLRRRFRGEPKSATELSGEQPTGGGGTGERAGLDTLMSRLDSMRLPGSSAWDAMTLDQRCDWWAKRVGRFLALLAGLPNFGGVITSRLPIRNALGTLGQSLVLSAIAAEHGVDDRAHQVRMIAKVVLDRDLPRAVAEGADGGTRHRDDERTAELTEELEESRRRYGRPRTRAVASTVWRMARLLWEIDSELDKRPQGRLHHEALGSLPVVGVVGGYLGERSALRRVARRGARWIRRNPPPHT